METMMKAIKDLYDAWYAMADSLDQNFAIRHADFAEVDRNLLQELYNQGVLWNVDMESAFVEYECIEHRVICIRAGNRWIQVNADGSVGIATD